MDTRSSALPFSQWMEQALFDPRSGYYTTRIKTLGRQGDFSTSATASPLLGKAIARWLEACRRRCPGVRAVIEVGGGDGSLSHAVRQALGWWRGRFYAWHMVETSPILRARQQERLPQSVVWHESIVSALAACEGRAHLFHNELVDAFPATLLQWDAQEKVWKEVWLAPQAGRWKEEFHSCPLDAAPFSALCHWTAHHPPPHPKQRVELHASFRAWLSQLAPSWRGGEMLTVDYGDHFPQLYHRQPGGTLRAYLLHQRLTGPEIYLNKGRQDLTADVNFTDLEAWGEALGWEDSHVVTQSAFLHEQLPGLKKSLTAASPDAFIADPEGAGKAFKVWTVRRGAA